MLPDYKRSNPQITQIRQIRSQQPQKDTKRHKKFKQRINEHSCSFLGAEQPEKSGAAEARDRRHVGDEAQNYCDGEIEGAVEKGAAGIKVERRVRGESAGGKDRDRAQAGAKPCRMGQEQGAVGGGRRNRDAGS